MSDSDAGSCGAAQTVVTGTVSDVRKDPRSNPGDKTKSNTVMEGDFNATNKIVYGVRMMSDTRGHHLMPEEIFSKKTRMADDRTLCKTLFYDITQQA
jgi:hypothetical protein